MEEGQAHYCWFKIAPSPDSAPLHVTVGQASASSRAAVEPSSALESIVADVAAAGRLGIYYGDRPPGMVGLLAAGLWRMDAGYTGVASQGKTIEYHPVYGTRNQAVDWLMHTAEGQEWISGAENYFLMSFDVLDLNELLAQAKGVSK